MKFGENLKDLRKTKKLSQEELAEKVGVSRQSVSKWECGEAYPEMTNILALCSLFKCKLNDIVHEDLSDIDSLGEEVKMSIVKFEKEKQNKIRVISKFIYVVAIVGKIMSIIAMVALAISMIAVPILINNTKIVDDEHIEVFGEKINYEDNYNGITFTYDGNKVEVTGSEAYMIIDIIEEMSNSWAIVFVEIAIALAITVCILMFFILKHLEILFKNIHNGDTPFTLDNANHIKIIAILMIVAIVIPYPGGILLGIVANSSPSLGFDLISLITILFLFSMVYIFEYGYEIQQDSNGKMYGEG